MYLICAVVHLNTCLIPTSLFKITPRAFKAPGPGAEGRPRARPEEPGCEEDSRSSAACLLCQVLAAPTAPVPALARWLPAQCRRGSGAGSQRHGGISEPAESCWLGTNFHHIAAAAGAAGATRHGWQARPGRIRGGLPRGCPWLWGEESGSGAAQGQPPTPRGVCPLSSGSATCAGEDTEPTCASGAGWGSWIWSDLCCQHQQNDPWALCPGSGL